MAIRRLLQMVVVQFVVAVAAVEVVVLEVELVVVAFASAASDVPG